MDNSLRVAIQFIRAFTFANVVEISRSQSIPESLHLFLPTHQLPLPEDSDQVLALFPCDSIVTVKDRLLASYRFIGLQDSILIMGPFRSQTLRRYEASEQLKICHADSDLLEHYMRYYNALPYISEETANIATENLLITLYGEAHGVSEHHIDMSTHHTTTLDSALPTPFVTVDSIQSRHNLEEFYMAQIEKGDFARAYPAFQQLSRQSTPVGASMDIEGFSIVCTMTRIAAREGGAPAAGLHTITEAYRSRIRHSNQADEIQNLVYQYIREICAIVRRNQTMPYSQVICQTIEYISRNLNSSLSLDSIADEIGISPAWLSTRFHNETGHTLTNYIMRERMRTASDYLAFTSIPVQEVSTSVGILDNNYFTKVFKKFYHMTPTEYRMQHKHGR